MSRFYPSIFFKWNVSRYRIAFHDLSPAYLFRGRFEVRQSFFSMLCRDIGMVLLAVLDGRLEVRDPLCGMGIGLGLLSRLGVGERGFGMRHEHIRMSLLAVINGFLRMADRFGQVILG
jgi:hypothetical protein